MILILSVIVSVSTLVIDELGNFKEKEKLLLLLNSINCIIAVSYFLIDLIFNYLFQSSEELRRKDYFDNSLNTHFTEQESTEYFTNDTIPKGILKLGVNGFENSFFSKKIADAMLGKMIGVSLIIILLFLCIALWGDNKLVVLILQLALPLTILQKTIRLFIYKKRIEAVFDQYQVIFSAAIDSAKESLILHNVITYESILAWGGIQLSSKAFNRLNPTLSKEWLIIKSRHGIN